MALFLFALWVVLNGGWRMDVADELTDEFIAQIKAAAVAEKDDSVLIGEVWEDASNKLAYGKLRQYFQGKELKQLEWEKIFMKNMKK